MLSTQMKGLVGPGARNICQQWQRAKKQVTNNTEHVTQKTAPWTQAPAMCEKTFSTYFVSQPVETKTSHKPLGAIGKLTAANYIALRAQHHKGTNNQPMLACDVWKV